GDEDRVHPEERRAPGAIADATGTQSAAELRRDVVEEGDIIGSDRGAIAGEITDGGGDQPEVTLVTAGDDFSNEGRPRGAGKRDARLRVPEDVHPEGDAHRGTQLADHRGHRRG